MNDAPKSIESDDERFDELMELQDPMRLGEFEEDVPKSIEDKYERQILMEKVIQPLVERLFDKQKGQNAQ